MKIQEQFSSVSERFERMVAVLAERGAGIPVEGSIVKTTPDGLPTAFRAIYVLTVQPPTVTEIVVTGMQDVDGRGAPTATITHVGIGSQGTPLVSSGRHTHNVVPGAAEAYAAMCLTPTAVMGSRPAAAYFDSVEQNLQSLQVWE